MARIQSMYKVFFEESIIEGHVGYVQPHVIFD